MVENVYAIDKKTKDSIITAFNCFNTGFIANKNNSNITLPPLSGRLHKTFILFDSTIKDRNSKNKKYVVQKLRLMPFNLKAVEHMLQLMEAAQKRAESNDAFKEGGILEDWKKVKYFDVKGGEHKEISGIQIGQKILYESDNQGIIVTAWRVLEFVEGKIYGRFIEIGGDENDVQHRRQYQLKAAELLGEAIAKFIMLMNFIPEDLEFMNTLPGFHDTQGYIVEVNSLLAGKNVSVRPGNDIQKARIVSGLLDGKYKEGKYTKRVMTMIKIFRSTSSLADVFKSLPLKLRQAIAHGDLKINNIIWATNGKNRPVHVKCFIDLDTIGRYTALDDFGDAARSIINVLGEDIWNKGKTLSEIILDREAFENLKEGYIKKIAKSCDSSTLRRIEICLYRSVAVYFFQLGTRFFKAFISELTKPIVGDNMRHFVYFIKHSDKEPEDKNLRLAEVQYMALVKFLNEFNEELKLNEIGIDINNLCEPFGW